MIKYTTRAFDFLKIQYPNITDKINRLLYIYPLLFSVCICIFFALIDYHSLTHINIFTHKAFDNISTFVQVLPGFYIGSLSAIASYSYPVMDNMMLSPTPYLVENVNGGERPSKLSRRRYLTLMFGYLSALSIIGAIFIFFTRLVYDIQIFTVTPVLYYTVYYSMILIFFFFFSQMLLVTMFGIYYLADRMHRQ